MPLRFMGKWMNSNNDGKKEILYWWSDGKKEILYWWSDGKKEILYWWSTPYSFSAMVRPLEIFLIYSNLANSILPSI